MLLLPPDRSLKKPLQAQLIEQLQQLIHSGRLAPLTRMPATRELAERLSVSRTTVLIVYDELIAEGYLQTEPAVGTFVSTHPPGLGTRLRVVAASGDPKDGEAATRSDGIAMPTFDFRAAADDVRLFPRKAWRGLLSRLLREGGWEQEPDRFGGVERLRRAIARWIAAERGVKVSPDQILVVSGLRQAQQILACLLLARGKIALVDRNFLSSVSPAFVAAGARVMPLPAENAALLPHLLAAGGRRTALIWLVLPSAAAPELHRSWWKRRERLLDWARVTGAAVVEYEHADHGTSPVPPPRREAPNAMIRLAGFSPTLGCGARLAYIVLPHRLVEPARKLKMALEDSRCWLEQMALACFIEDGGYARHVRRVDKIYRLRRAALVDALQRHFAAPRLIEVPAAEHVRWPLPPDFPAAATVRRHAAACGVLVDVGDEDVADAASEGQGTLCLGYGRLDEQQIAVAVAQLAAVIAALQLGDGAADRQGVAPADRDRRDFA